MKEEDTGAALEDDVDAEASAGVLHEVLCRLASTSLHAHATALDERSASAQ